MALGLSLFSVLVLTGCSNNSANVSDTSTKTEKTANNSTKKPQKGSSTKRPAKGQDLFYYEELNDSQKSKVKITLSGDQDPNDEGSYLITLHIKNRFSDKVQLKQKDLQIFMDGDYLGDTDFGGDILVEPGKSVSIEDKTPIPVTVMSRENSYLVYGREFKLGKLSSVLSYGVADATKETQSKVGSTTTEEPSKTDDSETQAKDPSINDWSYRDTNHHGSKPTVDNAVQAFCANENASMTTPVGPNEETIENLRGIREDGTWALTDGQGTYWYVNDNSTITYPDGTVKKMSMKNVL